MIYDAENGRWFLNQRTKEQFYFSRVEPAQDVILPDYYQVKVFSGVPTICYKDDLPPEWVKERKKRLAREKALIYWRSHKELRNQIHRTYYAKHREKLAAWDRNYRRNWLKALRKKCLIAYSGNPPKCACCGESTEEFLTIDHINGGGRKHRRQLGRSPTSFPLWLIRNSFPPGFRILCYNCNCVRAHAGYCPHEKKQEAPRIAA
jgi:hypothetical protein